jgi:hypothetical protein
LYVGDLNDTASWLLPVFDMTSAAKTKRLIATNLYHFDHVSKRIPQAQHRALRAQLLGAAQSHGMAVASSDTHVLVTDDEMLMMLAERAATRVLDDMASLYEW